MNLTTLRTFAGAALASTLALAVHAQTEPATSASERAADSSQAENPILDELNRTPNISMFAEPDDPNVRKANVVVNGDVVTDTDVEQRLNLVLASNPTDLDEQEQLRLRLQVMRNLIDEKLQIQESAENDIVVTDQDLTDAFGRVAQNFQMTPEKFGNYLETRGTSPMSIKQQIRAELAWGRLLRRRVEPFVNVGDDEVESMIADMEANKGTDEFRIAELVLFTSPENAAQVKAQADGIAEQLAQGAAFVAYARQYSESSTATLGGDLGWVQLEQLPQELQPIVARMQEGQITQPIQIPGAVVILALVDKRQVLTANEDDAILSLKQISVNLSPETSEEDARSLVARMNDAITGMGGCGGVEGVAQQLGGEVTVNDSLRLGDLPPQLKDVVGQMQIGQSTPPFGSLQEGLKVLTLCGREQPNEVAAPNFTAMYQQLEESRVNMAARRYLRDLRREAIIDYR
ncbi:peptidylprolyl isomerase [Pacificimonas flava]|uniref:Parvulin-like PPIase n=1 Tax=Pacificimonas flava TaxID=1234595 RepID=M2SG82_9SPHN|nr:peptidylprolyl isomerase [Pacificimonas flava]EMD84365.1 Survival protein SurA precursor (Peptidyl-prolyl cis-trans isomerase SurA) [Pacificimonas flava]MBB5279760.1 peptidyl-prolyl cis-trans isomerase SurA [Pacificimonas flava]